MLSSNERRMYVLGLATVARAQFRQSGRLPRADELPRRFFGPRFRSLTPLRHEASLVAESGLSGLVMLRSFSDYFGTRLVDGDDIKSLRVPGPGALLGAFAQRIES